MALLWIGLGFSAFGALIGTIAGLSTAELTTMLLGLLFAMIGGSLGAFLGKLDTAGRQPTGIALFTFSVSAILGLYGGLYVRINNILLVTPPDQIAQTTVTKTGDTYLQGLNIKLVDFLKLEVSRDNMTLPQACKLLRENGEATNAE
jgi:hypothetical protein